MEIILIIILSSIFIFLIFSCIYLYIELEEYKETILSFIEKQEDVKSRGIQLAKSLEEQLSEYRELVEHIKEKSRQDRLARKIFNKLYLDKCINNDGQNKPAGYGANSTDIMN